MLRVRINLIRFWRKISSIGIDSTVPEELHQYIMISNRFAFTWSTVIIFYTALLAYYDSRSILYLTGLFLVHVSAITLNYFKKFTISRFIESGIPIIFIYLFAAKVYNPADAAESRIESYKILNIAFFILPFMVFSLKEYKYIIIGSLISFICYVTIEPLIGVFSDQTTVSLYASFSFELLNYLVAIFLLAISMSYFKSINEKNKQKIKNLLNKSINDNKELNVAYAKANESNKLKEQFLANTTHEIRTPLNAIYGYTNLMMNYEKDKRLQGYLNNIRISTENLMVIINDILDISKIEAGKMVVENVPFRLRDVVGNLMETISIKASEKKQILYSHIDQNVGQILKGDPHRLYQILINLLYNAIKFTPEEGKISLLVTSTIDSSGAHWVYFSVKDNGIGIAREKQNIIFESFTQADYFITSQYGGTGLGLTIVKKLVDLQNGTISLESELGKGSVFTAALPYQICEDDLIIHKPINHASLGECHPQDIRILLVEDNELNIMLACDSIENWNNKIHIDVARNGQEAIYLVTQNEYDMVFMDIQMPVMNGIEATLFIRNKLLLDIPIIAMSANSPHGMDSDDNNYGFNGNITKPFEPDDLYNTIKLYSCRKSRKRRKEGQGIELATFLCDYRNDIGIPVNTIDEVIIDNNIEVNNWLKKCEFKKIDLNRIVKMHSGKLDKVIKTILLFLEHIDNEINDIKKFHEEHNYEALQASAHKLRPKMKLIGLTESFECLKFVEESIKNKKSDNDLIDYINVIIIEWTQGKQELKEVISNNMQQ